MSLNARESLSALMDNEGDELELRRVLKALDGDQDSAESWRRYHLMRSALRRETDTDPSVDLSAGIMADWRMSLLRWWSRPHKAQRSVEALVWHAELALAAAVSLMVISGVQFYNSVL